MLIALTHVAKQNRINFAAHPKFVLSANNLCYFNMLHPQAFSLLSQFEALNKLGGAKKIGSKTAILQDMSNE